MIEAGNSGNIILIGMPGAGKSTVGPLLARKLGLSFADTDTIIKESDGRALGEIVAEDGMEVFLEIQKSVIMSAIFNGHVIATGGGVVKSGDLMDFFKKTGSIIYLKQDYSTLESRLAPERRLARAGGQTFKEVFDERDPLYTKYADKIIVCSVKTPEKIVQEIIHD